MLNLIVLNDEALLRKCAKVVLSCETEGQFEGAERFVGLIESRLVTEGAKQDLKTFAAFVKFERHKLKEKA